MTSSKTFILNDRMLKIDLSSLERTCNAVNFKLSQQIQRLLTRLLMIHYTGKLHVIDSNHVELSIPDPELLQEDGPKELSSKHLYINLSKFAMFIAAQVLPFSTSVSGANERYNFIAF